jgi:hypothetical protein
MIDSNDDSIEPASARSSADEDTLEDGWFADRRSGSLPPQRITSVPPMGEDDVDAWLR